MPKRIIITIIICCITLTACLPVANASGNGMNNNSPETNTSDSDQEESASNTSIFAEDVVYSFLTAYENNSEEMILYLDDSLKESLPSGGIRELLNLGDTLEGMVFVEGASAPGTDVAIVEAHIQSNDQVMVRTFTLQQQGNTWLITSIE